MKSLTIVIHRNLHTLRIVISSVVCAAQHTHSKGCSITLIAMVYAAIMYILAELTLFEEVVFIVELRHYRSAGEGVAGGGASQGDKHGVLTEQWRVDHYCIVTSCLFFHLHQPVNSFHLTVYLQWVKFELYT